MNTELNLYFPAVISDIIIDFAKENPGKDAFVKELDYIRCEWNKHVIETTQGLVINWAEVEKDDQFYLPSLVWEIQNWDE